MTDQPDDTAAHEALDKAIRGHAASELSPDGEVIVSWLALVAVRRHDGGGTVISLPSGVMPYWEARGLLAEAMAALDRMAARESDN